MFRGKSIYKNDSVLTIVENPRVAAYRDDRISDRSEVVVLLLTCVAKVASVGLIHPVTMSPTPSWDDSYSSLVAYKRRHGHCNIKQRCKIYPKLARWVKTQRCLNRSGKLLPERKQKLSSLGFQWEVTRRDNNFSRTGIKLLGEFKRKHGVRWIPARYTYNGFKLGWWLQRQQRAQDEETIFELRRLGYWPMPPYNSSPVNYTECENRRRNEWHKKHNELQLVLASSAQPDIPCDSSLGSLSTWVAQQMSILRHPTVQIETWKAVKLKHSDFHRLTVTKNASVVGKSNMASISAVSPINRSPTPLAHIKSAADIRFCTNATKRCLANLAMTDKGFRFRSEVQFDENLSRAKLPAQLLNSGLEGKNVLDMLTRLQVLNSRGAIEVASSPYIYIEETAWSTAEKPCYGVRTRRSIQAGAFIATCAGIISRKPTLKSRYEMQMLAAPSWCINADRMGNETRFINHSCKPNCIAIAADDGDGLPCVNAYAGKESIPAGSWLTLFYRCPLFETCRCGEKNCLGDELIRSAPYK